MSTFIMFILKLKLWKMAERHYNDTIININILHHQWIATKKRKNFINRSREAYRQKKCDCDMEYFCELIANNCNCIFLNEMAWRKLNVVLNDNCYYIHRHHMLLLFSYFFLSSVDMNICREIVTETSYRILVFKVPLLLLLFEIAVMYIAKLYRNKLYLQPISTNLLSNVFKNLFEKLSICMSLGKGVSNWIS